MVVFFSNCDSVEFHHELFRRDLQLSHSHSHSHSGADAAEPVKLLGSVPVLKLHGDMLQPERTSSLVTFAKVCRHHCCVCAAHQQQQRKPAPDMLIA
jgi:superfamily II DNA/RNA helicase